MASTPASEHELLIRAQALAGFTLKELAQELAMAIPKTALNAKGWVGQLLEVALGAVAGSKPLPDFMHLGIELKTIPVTCAGKPRETTYVCSIPLMKIANESWECSTCCRKLSQVLWIPIQSDPQLAFEARIIGNPLLWRPSASQLRVLQRDWQELTGMIAEGKVESITGKHGQALQIRPKAANSKALCYAINEQGEIIQTLPRGFYLRTHFTQEIVNASYRIDQ